MISHLLQQRNKGRNNSKIIAYTVEESQLSNTPFFEFFVDSMY
jgi:hypothetical protein